MAQPMPPDVAETNGEPEPVKTWLQRIGWDRYTQTNGTAFVLKVANAGTNYSTGLPITETNTLFYAAMGANVVTLTVTNKGGAGEMTCTWQAEEQKWCEFWCFGQSSLTSNWQRIDPKPQRADKPMLFARAAISNWTTTNWSTVP